MTAAVDILILGAGPAGCAAALRASNAGMRVLIVDTSAAPKIAPGETLHPGIEPLLHQLGVGDAFLQAGFTRHSGIWLDVEGTRTFSAYGEDAQGPWLGFQADRKMVGNLLHRAVMDCGATFIRKAQLNDVLVNDGSVTGAVINGNAVQASWTIDATGRNAWLARRLALTTELHSSPLGVKFGWSEAQDDPTLDGQPLFRFRDDGWDWQAPINSQRTAWVELRIGNGNEAPPGMNLTWQLRPDCAGPGYMLLGDAATLFDPSSSHGVLRALMSGILCGHLLQGWRNGNLTRAQVIEAYREWIHTQFMHEKNKLMQFYINSPAAEKFTAGMSLHR